MQQTKPLPLALIGGVVFVLLVGSMIFLNSLIVPGAPADSKSLVSEISADRFFNNVKYLASDEMKGRGDGSPELEKAADYIAAQFRSLGLQPAGENGTSFQSLDVMTGVEFGSGNFLSVNGAPARIDSDFTPISFSNTGSFDGPAAFVGYGITAPEYKYDDYQGIDVNGKIVIALRDEPQENDPKSVFEGTNLTAHAQLIAKAINARQHGAKGIVFVTDPVNHAGEADAIGPATKDSETEDVGISSVHARRDVVSPLFGKPGKGLADLQQKIDKDLKSQSFDIPESRISISTNVIRTHKTVRNVLAAIPGSDPALRDQWVVVGAHYDHLGLGGRDSLAPSQIGQIHHGADDNASGTSGVLELARLVSQHRDLKRSVLFMTFAGEELGLFGSAYYVNHPTEPLDHTVAMLNMDMIGRVQNDKLYVGGVGTAANLKPWVEEANRSVGLNLDYSDSGYGSSDHTSFTTKHIPVLFFFSGLHSDYHKPSDTYDKINAEGARKVLSLAYMMLDRIANTGEQLPFVEVKQVQPTGGSGGGSGYGPYFGSVPDFAEDLHGVKFADVRPDSPAAKAGLKPGDLMTSFDGKAIDNLYDFTFALRPKKPGDVVVVVVKRSGQEIKVNVTLEARK